MNFRTMTKQELASAESAAMVESTRLLDLVDVQTAIVNSVNAERQRRVDELRSCRTPEDFAAKGFDLNACDICDYAVGGEYRERLKNGLPTKGPKFKVGDWAYNHVWRENARVVRVTWEAPAGGLIGGWRYSIPGMSAYELGGSHEKAPFVDYETCDGTTYRQVPPKATGPTGAVDAAGAVGVMSGT